MIQTWLCATTLKVARLQTIDVVDVGMSFECAGVSKRERRVFMAGAEPQPFFPYGVQMRG